MFELLILIGFRMLSGIKNNFGYRQIETWTMGFGLMACSLCFAANPNTWYSWPMMLFAASSQAMCGLSFFAPLTANKYFRDIHLWEAASNYAFPIGCLLCGFPLLTVALSVAPSMVLHKGFINLAFSMPFIDPTEVTDDQTGQTTGVPSLGLKIKRFISNGYVRLIIATLCIFAFILTNYVFDVKIFGYEVEKINIMDAISIIF